MNIFYQIGIVIFIAIIFCVGCLIFVDDCFKRIDRKEQDKLRRKWMKDE